MFALGLLPIASNNLASPPINNMSDAMDSNSQNGQPEQIN
jgi:hypothetical protein